MSLPVVHTSKGNISWKKSYDEMAKEYEKIQGRFANAIMLDDLGSSYKPCIIFNKKQFTITEEETHYTLTRKDSP